MPPGFTQVNNATLALPPVQTPAVSAPTQTDAQRDNAFRDAGLTSTEQSAVLAGNPTAAAAAAQRANDTAGATGVVADNGTARADEKTLGDRIRNEVMNPTLDLKYLDEYEARLNERRVAEEKNINTNFDNLKVSTERQQQGEVGSTSSALARAGGYLGVSGSGTGVLLNLANTHRAEMSQIEAKRQDALAAARSAYEDKQFAIAQKRYDEAKAFKDQSFTRQKEYFDTVKKTMDDIKKTERAKEVNNLIYGAINEGKTDPTDIFGALDGQVTPEEVDGFFKKLKPKTKDADIFKPTNTQAALMLGAGFSSKDVTDLTSEINSGGYTDDIKKRLTATQRRVMDSILTMAPVKAAARSGASADTFNNDEKKALVKFLSDVGSVDPVEGLTFREAAFEYIRANQTTITTQVGNEGLQVLLDEIDRLHPETEEDVQTGEAQTSFLQSLGSSLRSDGAEIITPFGAARSTFPTQDEQTESIYQYLFGK